jgi:hypothetical protein
MLQFIIALVVVLFLGLFVMLSVPMRDDDGQPATETPPSQP